MTFDAKKETLKKEKYIYAECTQSYLNDCMQECMNSIVFDGIIYSDKYIGDEIKGLKKYSLSDLDHNKCVIIICQELKDNIRNTIAKLRKNNFVCDHIANYGRNISVRILLSLDFDNYIDLKNNSFNISNIIHNGSLIIKKDDLSIADCKVEINSVEVFTRLLVVLYGNSSKIKIGKSSFLDVQLQVTTNGSITIGNDCIFGHNVLISQPDQHLIFDIATKKRVNVNKNIVIGNHIWVGRTVSLLGGCLIPDNCIIGANSTTSARFKKTSCVIAGNPARVIRENILWSRDNQNKDYENYEDCDEQLAPKYFTEDEKKTFIGE